MLVFIVNLQYSEFTTKRIIKMKKILLATILLVPFLSFADSDASKSSEAKQEKFQAHKEKVLKRIDEKKACVTSAATKDDLKACKKHKKHHDKKDK